MAPLSPKSPPPPPCSVSPRFTAFCAVAALLLLPACKPKDAGLPPVVATVGDTPLRADAFAEAALHRSGGRPAELDRRALLDELILREASLKRARELGLDREPATRRALEDTLLAALRARELEPALRAAANVSDADVEARHAAAPDRFTLPATRRVAWLRQLLPPGADPAAARARLEAARAAWTALPPDPTRRGFGPLATEFSDDPDTRYTGGDLGVLAPDNARLPEPLRAAAAALAAPGELSPVVVTPEAAYLVLLVAHTPASVLPFERVRPRLIAELIAEREKAARAAYDATLLARYPVTRDDARAASIPLPAASTPNDAPPPLP